MLTCVSVLLSAQDRATWESANTQKLYRLLLGCVVESRAKVRRVARTSVTELVTAFGSSDQSHPVVSITSAYVLKHLDSVRWSPGHPV